MDKCVAVVGLIQEIAVARCSDCQAGAELTRSCGGVL